MPLVKDAIKYGALFGVAREGGKALERREKNKIDNQVPPQQGQYQQQSQPQQGYNYQQDRDSSGYSDQHQPPPSYNNQQGRASSSYLHQSWCNGQCNGQCASTSGVAGKQ